MKKLQNLFGKYKALSWPKKILILGVLVILIFLLVKRFSSTQDSPQYQFATVERGKIVDSVSETGEIVTSNKVDVATTINGVVKEVYVNNSDWVKRGDSLFYVTSTATEADRSQAYAAYLSAKNNLAAAQTKKKTLESTMWQAHETFESKALDTELSVDDPIFIETERDWQAAESTYINHDQVISQSQASLNQAWLDYQATLNGPVKATADGQIANLSLAAGQSVLSTDTALIIKTQADTWVKVGFNESDVIGIEPGQSAQVEVDALSQVKLPATVQRVDEFGTVVSDVSIYYVYLSLNETDVRIRPAMTVQVDIITQQKDDAFLIPNTAIKAYQGEKAVQIWDDITQSVIYQPIQLGVKGDSNSEVVSGLEEGQKIIIGSSTSGANSGSSGGMMFGGQPGN